MNVAILGLGVVGMGVYDILLRDVPDIKVKYVMELDQEKTKNLDVIVANHISTILEDDTLDTVIELIGGKRIAYTFVKQALQAKKNVVTANKALISDYFEELTELANENGVILRYEASVGGAINVLDPLLTIAKINHIHKIEGIINGSTNFILSKIFLEDYDLDKALEAARNLGYIETGTNDDLEGFDLLRKINILSMMSYGQYIKEEEIIRVGLDTIPREFYEYVKSKGLTMKYIATSEWKNNQIMVHLEPVIVSQDHFYTKINYEENIVTLYGAYHNKQSFIGQGAGRYPTASAVVYDLLKIKEQDHARLQYKNNFVINKNLNKYRFLVLKNGKFLKTESMTFESLLVDKEIQAFARIDEGAYESI
ncbi:MAG: homoserine dehydrogenase [Bacilli bacterium]|nr:homoserine dehydrogenase [Bacilli bacterium]MBN2876667.1 homoserine dehydrogenase [Bacilli bacterium]